jgi:hypothetical protein
MSNLQKILDRASMDPSFRTQLAEEPHKALAGYELSDEERDELQEKAQSMMLGTANELGGSEMR